MGENNSSEIRVRPLGEDLLKHRKRCRNSFSLQVVQTFALVQ